MMMRKTFFNILFITSCFSAFTQDTTAVFADTTVKLHFDTSLRIMNINPFFSLHVDSVLNYQLQLNKNSQNFYWYIKSAPAGLRVSKDGLIQFKAEKSHFISGRLKYDQQYPVILGVQNLLDPTEKIDTSFSIIFYNTEVIPSRVKPSVGNSVVIEEGEKLSFKVFCESGSYPFEDIITLTSIPLTNFSAVEHCGGEFGWTPPFDLVKESDPGKEKSLQLHFVGINRFQMRDTATIRVVVKDAMNYPLVMTEYQQVAKNIQRYVLQLKYTFLLLDKRLKKTKSMRTGFDLTSASTSLTGTILSTSSDPSNQRTGKILPSVGLALVPIKEASVPNKMVDQNQAAQIRTSIKRLEYMLQDNQLIGDRDPDLSRKTNKLKDELKQVQMQLIEVPLELTNDLSEEELNRYFNSPKVNKKYRLSGK